MKCYCCSGKDFEACCRPYLKSVSLPETAEQLMRSRYSAYVLADEGYLRASWVADQCPQDLNLEEQVKWIKLEVLAAGASQQSDQIAQVEFKAWFIQHDKLLCIHEKSDFQQENGRWLYHSGCLYEEPAVSLSMNQSCPCGSGKKYKRCCRN